MLLPHFAHLFPHLLFIIVTDKSEYQTHCKAYQRNADAQIEMRSEHGGIGVYLKFYRDCKYSSKVLTLIFIMPFSSSLNGIYAFLSLYSSPLSGQYAENP